MNSYFERFMETSSTIRLGVLVISILIVGVTYWVFFHSGLSFEIHSLQEQITNLDSEIAAKRGLRARLPEVEARVKVLDVELQQALQELPDRREIPNLLSRISDKARDAGLEIKLFKPAGQTKRDFYAEVPVEIEVGGTYHQVATFFDEVGHMERIINLSNYSLGQPSVHDEEVFLQTALTATAYRFLDENERPSEMDQADQKRRRR